MCRVTHNIPSREGIEWITLGHDIKINPYNFHIIFKATTLNFSSSPNHLYLLPLYAIVSSANGAAKDDKDKVHCKPCTISSNTHSIMASALTKYNSSYHFVPSSSYCQLLFPSIQQTYKSFLFLQFLQTLIYSPNI